MKLDRIFWTRVSVESLLIVFSVFLALLLGDSWAQSKEAAATERQLASIHAELMANRVVVGEWLKRHEAISVRVANLRVARDPGEPLIVDDQLQLGRVFGSSLLESMVRSTAWETAKTTGLVKNLSFELVQALTDVYGLQEQPVRTVDRIVSLIFDRESHREENLAGTLVLFQMLLAELRGQEQLLLKSYDHTYEIVGRDLDSE